MAIKFVNFYWSENILPLFEDFIFKYKILGWQSFSFQSTLLNYNWHYKKLYIFSIYNLMRQYLFFQHFRDALPLFLIRILLSFLSSVFWLLLIFLLVTISAICALCIVVWFSLWLYSWNFLNLLAMWAYNFHQIRKILAFK